MTVADVRAVLSKNLLFRDLPDATLERIAKIAIQRSYPKDNIIFLQGDPGDALYGVLAGQVRISATAANAEVFLNIMEPGDAFGEIALIDGEPRTATATAMTDCDLAMIHRDHFLDLLKSEPLLTLHLLQLFCARVRWTSELAEDSALLSVPARLAKRLLSLAEHHGTQTDAGIEMRISQGELSQFLNVSRQAVNQYLQDWLKAGWLELSRSRIVVRDRDAISRVADDAA